MTIAKRHALVALLLVIPTAAFANAIVPILNFFNRETWQPAALATLVIILVEAALLRWRIKTFPFIGTLWRVAVINLASSAAGSLVLAVAAEDSLFLWDSNAWLFNLFLITLMTEVPLLYALFKSTTFPWRRALALGVGVNVLSYAALIAIEITIAFLGISHAGRLDEEDARQWNHPELCKDAGGLIYTTAPGDPGRGLRVFNPSGMSWTTLTNSPPLSYGIWDVEGMSCAYASDGKDRLVIARLPDFEVLAETAIEMDDEHDIDLQAGIDTVAVSPDETKVAILYRLMRTVAPRNQSSHFYLGTTCKLLVLDIATREIVARSSRRFSGRQLCWLPDSQRILAASFDDETLYDIRLDDVNGSISYGIGYARGGKFSQSLYAFDIATGTTTRFAAGESPSLAVAAGAILVADEDGMCLLDASGNPLMRLDRLASRNQSAILSPSGDRMLAILMFRLPFRYGGRLVILDTRSPETRHVLEDGVGDRIDWTTARGSVNPDPHTLDNP